MRRTSQGTVAFLFLEILKCIKEFLILPFIKIKIPKTEYDNQLEY